MKRLADALLWIMAAAFLVIVLLLPLHAFISTWGGTAIGPLPVWKSWKEILLLGLLPIGMLYLLIRRDILKLLWSRWINRLILVYAAIHIIWAVMSPASQTAVVAGLLFNLRFLAIFMLAQIVLASGSKLAHKIKQSLAPILMVITILVSMLAILQVTVVPKDFLAQFGYNKDLTIAPYVLIDQNENALRAFATLRGPNALGSYLILPLMLALALVIAERRNVVAGLALGLGSVALALTGSRSAWIGAVIALLALAIEWLPRHKLMRGIKHAALPVLAVGTMVFGLSAIVPAVRLAVFHSSPGDATLLEGSSEKHWQAAAQGANEVIGKPLGHGVGTAGPASFYGQPNIAENYFVQVGQEVGVLGLIVFIAINVLIFYHLLSQRQNLWAKALLASFIGINVVNIFLHGWADDPTAMTWWGLAGLFAFSPPASAATIKKK